MYEALTARLGCPCQEFPAMKNPAPIMAAYEEARKRGAKEGFLPVLIAAEERSPMEALDWLEGGVTPEERRNAMLADPVLDGKAVLEKIANRHKEDYAGDGFDWPDPEVIGEMEGAEGVDHFLGISDYRGKTIPLVLAELPVKNPWEVFAWIPLGGWNECPCDEEQMGVAKYWFEKYGAVPAVITSDVLEYDLPAPVPQDQAMDLAMEQYAFCQDIVDQGCGTVGYLADSLAQSTKWFFWWD